MVLSLYDLLLPFSATEMIYFHPVPVIRKSEERKQYFIMHFLKKLNVLDKPKTDSSLMNPRVFANRLAGIDVFIYEEFDPGIFCISETVKNIMENENITGCSFQKIS